MTAVDVVGRPLSPAGDRDIASDAAQQGAAPSLANALVALFEDARAGRVSAAEPGGRWLILRIEEALRGFDDFQQMAVDDLPSTFAGGTAATPVDLDTTGATPRQPTQPPLGGRSVLSSHLKRKGEVR